MLVAGSGCSISLREMGKDGNVAMTDVEEGEISEAASVEISVGDFNQQEMKTSKRVKQLAAVGDCDGGGKGGSNGNTRVWRMRDLMAKYSACRGYSASGLYNFAWAQAVQNKPLNEALGRDVEPSKSTKAGSERSKEGDKIMIDHSGDEKEEGELEEGEIELESDPADKLADGIQTKTESDDLHREMETDDDGIRTETKERDLENRVKLIRSVLESTSLVEAHTAFEGVCSRLLWALESLRELVSENDTFPKRDTLVQLSFAALETINSVFCSMSKASKELNREIMSRLLSLVKSHLSPFLSSNQIKEIEAMSQFLSCFDVTPCIGTSNNVRERQLTDGIAQKDYDFMAANNGSAFSYVNKLSAASEASKRVASNLRNRAPLLPLLELHKDHDADSLPSPTREKAPCLPVDRSHSVGHGGLSAGKVGQATDDAKIHPYENEALKAFSNYQQKFSRNSLFKTDSLPSPTPSEESNDDDNGDIGGEVSSSVVPNSVPRSLLLSGKNFSLASNVNASEVPRINAAPNTIQPRYVSTPCPANNNLEPTVKPSAKSRDPRLRFANPDSTTLAINSHSLYNTSNNPKVEPSGVSMSSRKQKAADESYLDGPAQKRRKNGLESNEGVKEAPKTDGIGGWLDNTGSFEPPSLLLQKTESNPGMTGNSLISMTRSVLPGTNVSMSEPAPVTAATSTVSLPSLLKDIVVNPTILFNLLKMGEKPRVTETTHNKPTDPRKAAQLPGSSVSGTVPSVSVSVPSPLANLSKQGGAPKVSSQAIPKDEEGKIPMKPRDPRRVLLANTIQRTGSLVEKQFKVNEPPTSGSLDMKIRTEERAETKPVPSQLVQLQDFTLQITKNRKNVNDLTNKAPDIAPQFTKNLENIASIVAVSQVGNTAAVPQNQIPQSLQAKADRDVEHLASNSGEQQVVVGPAQLTAATSTARPPNGWVDVDHLFEGYDDKQKAAIHRERARRLEEQKKMFAARKLCLVLDLDHTLLNSAKFNEVDPVHDEILRKKEEQDREKPCRHLFRFPHMGMWTKLRPGVWNFLEKASKLYELHLYTMGNKLYATEMAKVLDPEGVLFNGRVISRGDDGDPCDGEERVPKSKDLEGVLGMESAVVIIDDSVRVWPHNKMNLIVVERYTYFPCSRRQFGLLGPSLLEIDHDERPEEGTLASSLAVIERIHQKFFSHSSLEETDVRNILSSEQRKILAGCRIVFSRVFPVGEANPHLHPLWQTAEQFGAVCTTQINENVTHVVANSLGTDKVNWALSKGRFVVHPGWVEASALLYRRANEDDFAIKP